MAALKERMTTKATDDEKSAMETMQEQQKEAMKGIKSLDELKASVMERMTATFDMLTGKGATGEDIDAYKQLIYNAALKTAEAAKEGGFMGIGGTRVSAKEQAALDEIKAALGI
jgi:xylose isomerase